MTEIEFWQSIDFIDIETLRSGDDIAALDPLIAELARMPVEEIESFEDHLAQALYGLDGRRYMAEAGLSESSDTFLYARCFVVALGQRHYERVLADPKLMPKTLEEWCEPLLFVAAAAWSKATGNDENEWEHDGPVSYETGSNSDGWATDPAAAG